MSESIRKKIEELNLELTSLETERDKFDGEATNWVKKRNSVHEQIRRLRTEANNLREKRDALNQRVKELKNLREQAKANRREKRNGISKLGERARTLRERKPSQSLQSIQKEIQGLEWKIQTTPLPVKQEEKLIGKVKRLETKRNILAQLQKLNDMLIELRSEEEALETRAKSYHEKLSELAETSQKLHEERLKILNQVHNLRVEADDAHSKYVEKRQKADGFHQRYKDLQQKINALKQKQREVEEAKQAKHQKQLLEEAQKKALEKMKRGEKLTWQEFKLITEQARSKKGQHKEV